MPAVVWPASLPQEPFVGFEETGEPNTVVTEVGSGPPKVRRRSTRERKIQSTTVWLTGTQVATFEAFWLNINQGAETFEWADMITGATAEFRFRSKPRWRNETPGDPITKRLYSATLDLERVN
jgi:hypothetical protein